MKYIYILLVFFVFSCNNNESHSVISIDVSNSADLVCKVIKNIEPSCYVQGVIKDSVLILLDQCRENMIQVYDSYSYLLLGEFGKKGRGPKEFISPVLVNDLERDTFYIHDRSQFRISKVNVKNLVSDIDSCKVLNCLLPRDLAQTYSLNRTDSLYVATSITSSSDSVLFFIFNRKQHRIKNIGYVPRYKIIEDKDPFIDLRTVYTNNIRVSSRHHSIIVAFKFLNLINFYDIEGNLKKSYSVNALKEEIDSRMIDCGDSTIVTFHDMYATNDFCYLIWNGHRIAEINSRVPTKIVVFDWKGNLQQVYNLNNCPQFIMVDEKQKKILGAVFSDDNEFMEICEYYNL